MVGAAAAPAPPTSSCRARSSASKLATAERPVRGTPTAMDSREHDPSTVQSGPLSIVRVPPVPPRYCSTPPPKRPTWYA